MVLLLPKTQNSKNLLIKLELVLNIVYFLYTNNYMLILEEKICV